MYLYAGASRRHDWAPVLKKVEEECGIRNSVTVEEFDLLDLSIFSAEEGGRRLRMLEKVRAADYEVIWVESPYQTWTRLLYASPGARPVRSRQYPMGFPWARGKSKARAERGNAQVQLAIELCVRARDAQLRTGRRVAFFWEMPEDLGGTGFGDPGSPWALARVRKLEEMQGMRTMAWRRCAYDVLPGPEPTRALTDLEPLLGLGVKGWPEFDEGMRYLGPLPRGCGHAHEVRDRERRARGPPGERVACPGWYEAVTRRLVSYFGEGEMKVRRTKVPRLRLSTAGTKDMVIREGPEVGVRKREGDAVQEEEDGAKKRKREEEESEDEDQGPGLRHGDGWWGRGLPVMVKRRKEVRPLETGGGLCDPGRWRPENRAYPEGEYIETIRKRIEAFAWAWQEKEGGLLAMRKLAYRVAAGKMVESPIPADLFKKLEEEVEEILKKAGVAPTHEESDVEQVYDVRRLQAMLKLAGDPDWRILTTYARGVPLGPGMKMPRTPAVFQKKRKWALSEEEGGSRKEWNENYASAKEYADVACEKIEGDAAKGRIIYRYLSEAREEYGPNLAVGALGIVEEGPKKYRLIHDGTHVIKINHMIRVRDQVATPVSGDIKAVQTEVSDDVEAQGPILRFSLTGDMADAHRTVAVREEDWGFQACEPPAKVKAPGRPPKKDDPLLALNTCGTFGIASAGYWWGRLGAHLLRLGHYYMPKRWRRFWLLLFADDFKITALGPEFALVVMTLLVIFMLPRASVKWKKGGGGLTYQWIGYEECLREFRLGLTASRMAWLLNWTRQVLKVGHVLVDDFRAALGRMGFATEVLESERPFLGPLHAWVAVVPGGAYVAIPLLVRMLLNWLERRWRERRTVSGRREIRVRGERFRADAKAADDDAGKPLAVIGGWDTSKGEDTTQALWYSEKLEPEDSPWAFRPKHPKRRIAAIELFATLVSIVAFIPEEPEEGYVQAGTFRMSGATDNQGNGHVVAKLMSSKFPLNIILMELSLQLELRGISLDLAWVRRDKNEEADALTNDDFSGFKEENRIRIDLKNHRWRVLRELMEEGLRLYAELEKEKAAFKAKEEEQRDAPTQKRLKKKKQASLKQRSPW